MNRAPEFQCGLILLAAGGSRRMGRAKQLLPIGGKPLLRFVAKRLLRSPVAPAVVVLGAEPDKVSATLTGLPVQIAINAAWTEGLGSSLRVGVESLLAKAPNLDALIVALGDQPGLPDGHPDLLIARYRQGGCSLVASPTGPRRVPPVLFGRDWFPRLRQLTGDAGAREILREDRPDFASVSLVDNTDLDTPEDYARYMKEDGAR